LDAQELKSLDGVVLTPPHDREMLDRGELSFKTPTSIKMDWDDMSSSSVFASLNLRVKLRAKEMSREVNAIVNSVLKSPGDQRSAASGMGHFNSACAFDTPELLQKQLTTQSAVTNDSCSSETKSCAVINYALLVDDNDDDGMQEEWDSLPFSAHVLRLSLARVDLALQQQANASPPRASHITMTGYKSGHFSNEMNAAIVSTFVLIWAMVVIVFFKARYDFMATDGMVQLPWMLRY
jgi:hypothetical protein